MVRITTKTSSFGTSKREGHDATQFYSSNLYQGLDIDEKQEIIDNSDTLQESLFLDPIKFSFEALQQIPDYSLHAIIVDLSDALDLDIIEKNIETNLKVLFQELYRILITGGRIGLIIDNHPKSASENLFQPFHAIITLQMLKVGFIMRGEVIWKKDNNSEAELIADEKNAENLESRYKHILIYSKQVLKRLKNANMDSISRDQFLQYTKSIWKPQRELINDVNSDFEYNKEIFDCYNRILQLYSFESDKILLVIPEKNIDLLAIMRQIRKGIVGFTFLQLFS